MVKKNIILHYTTESEIHKLIEKIKKIEYSSGASLCKRALTFYCKKILADNK